MNYITNPDRVSTEALSHGLTWGSHRYVRREGSPGNYRYIYPEDLKPTRGVGGHSAAITGFKKSWASGLGGSINRIRGNISANRSANTENASTFGDSMARTRLRSAQKQQKTFERSASKLSRKAEKQYSKAADLGTKANDLTLSDKIRKKYSEKAKAMQETMHKTMTDVQKMTSMAKAGESFISRYKSDYNRTRKIDDVPRAIVQEFQHLFGRKG